MLYDSLRWDHQRAAAPTPNPLSLVGLIAWLETQDPAASYVWFTSCHRCLLGQYMTAQGLTPRQCSENYGPLGRETCSLAFAKPRTYGAALARARALQTNHNLTIHDWT
jgi:hypothetical protein